MAANLNLNNSWNITFLVNFRKLLSGVVYNIIKINLKFTFSIGLGKKQSGDWKEGDKPGDEKVKL